MYIEDITLYAKDRQLYRKHYLTVFYLYVVATSIKRSCINFHVIKTEDCIDNVVTQCTLTHTEN